MDLGAFCQIENLEQIMKDNNIYVPRLRGLRLMSKEEPLSKKEIEELAKNEGLYRCKCLCESNFIINAGWLECSERTRRIEDKYLKFEYTAGIRNMMPIEVKWDKLHGKKRKAFKYVIKQARKDAFKQYEIWNKYCGRKDVLYIHARIGGGNWAYYRDEVENQPWFIEKIDDYFDSTYCDIYAKIGK